jgi:hypothetical protein
MLLTFLLAWAAAAIVSVDASNIHIRQFPNATTSAEPSHGLTSTHAPPATLSNLASRPSAGTATVTSSANGTRTGPISSITAAPSNGSNTCCYLYPKVVGINTWWSSSANITVATVITTWLQYGNNTPIAGNSTTKTVVNVTEIYGSHAVMTELYTQVPISVTGTTTDWYCGGFGASGMGCTETIWTTRTQFDYSTIWYNTSSIISGVPNSLLPEAAALYGRTSIGSTTVATFPSQGLEIKQPTPYFHFSGIDLYTSIECQATRTYTDYVDKWHPTTINGIATYATTTYPLYTTTAWESSSPINAGRSGNHYINQSVAKPFPDGDYSNFNFSDWADGVLIGPAPGNVDAYMFLLPDDLPEFFDSVPYIKSEYPDIGKCTNFAGDGEPTVHVQVNQLTDTQHVTMTLPGVLRPPTTSTPVKPPQAPVIESTAATLEPVTTRTGRAPIIESTAKTLEPPATPQLTFTGRPATAHIETTREQLEPAGTPDAKPPPTDEESDQAPDSPIPTRNPPNIISIIQQAGSQAQSPPPAPSKPAPPIGNIIASVIGLVPDRNPPATPQGQDEPPGQSDGPQTGASPASPPNTPPGPITVGGSVLVPDSSSRFVVGSQTLAPGGAPIVIGDNTVSLAESATAVVINGATSPVRRPQDAPADAGQPAAPQVTVGGSTFTANAQSDFVIGSQTLVPGGAPIVVGDDTVSLADSATAVVINGATNAIVQPAPQAQAVQTPAPQVTVGGSVYTADSQSNFIIGSQTLAPGGAPIVVGDDTVSLADSATAVVINGATNAIVQPAPQAQAVQTPAPQVTVGGSVYTEDGQSNFVIGSQTLAPGGAAITVDGSTLSLSPSASAIVINGEESAIAVPVGSPVTLDGLVATPIADDAYILAQGGTLSPGGPSIVQGGTTYSLLSSGDSIVVNGVTSAVPNTATAVPTGSAIATIGAQTLNAGGPAITVSGTTYSVTGTDVVVAASGRTTTEALSEFQASVRSKSTSGPLSPASATSGVSADGTSDGSSAASTSDSGCVRWSTKTLVTALVFCLAWLEIA